MGLFNSVLNTIQHIADNRNARNINRDNQQAAVMASTGLNTQADKYSMFSSLSKDGASVHTNMTWSASAMLSNMFGKGGSGITGMFTGQKTNADGSTSTVSGMARFKPLLIIGGAILTIFGLKRLFGGRKRKKSKR